MSLANQKIKHAILGVVYGMAMFSGTDVTGELDAGGLTRIEGANFSIVRASGSVQTAIVGTVSATSTFNITLPNVRGSVSAIKITSSAGITASDTNSWKVGVINKGTDGMGTAVVVNDATAANTTLATGGAAFVAATQRTMTLTGTSGDKVVTEGQVLAVTLTKTGTPVTLGTITIEITVTGAAAAADEQIQIDELQNNDGQIEVQADGKITLTRTGASPSNNLHFYYELRGF